MELIDLRDWNLPGSDEPRIPAQGTYAQDHTRAWSAKVSEASGIVIVTPQHNWGYPHQNALDLYKEWNDKPLAIVTYGGHVAATAVPSFAKWRKGLKMQLVTTMPAISISREQIETDTPQTPEDLMPFEAVVVRAMNELHSLLE